MNKEEINDLIKQLDEKGEKQVRQELAEGRYGEWKEKIINNWLNNHEREAADKKYYENLEIIRSQKNSSWVAAITSIISAIVAIIAAIISIYNGK